MDSGADVLSSQALLLKVFLLVGVLSALDDPGPDRVTVAVERA